MRLTSQHPEGVANQPDPLRNQANSLPNRRLLLKMEVFNQSSSMFI